MASVQVDALIDNFHGKPGPSPKRFPKPHWEATCKPLDNVLREYVVEQPI